MVNQRTDKTAIVVHGGAIKAAFAAGTMYGLSKIGIQNADIVVGTSSSVPTMAYFASKQFELIKDIWLKEVGNREFVNYVNLFKGKPIFNLHYLIDVVFKHKYPLAVENIMESASLFLIPLYNYREARVEFFSNRQVQTRTDFWKILQAAITIHNENILKETNFEQYVDSDLDPFSFYRQEIIPANHNVLLVINHKDLDNTLKRWMGVRIFRLLQSRHFPKGVKEKLKIRAELIRSGFKLFEQFKRKYRPLIISPPPTTKLSVGTLIARDKKKLELLFDDGVQAVTDVVVNNKTRQALEVFIARSTSLSKS